MLRPSKYPERQLGLARGTVRRLARASTADDLLAGRRLPSGPRILDPYSDHLRRRRVDGVTNAAALFAEIRALGYRGGYNRRHRCRAASRPVSAPSAEADSVRSPVRDRVGQGDEAPLGVRRAGETWCHTPAAGWAAYPRRESAS
jgi:hypothetical protein